MVQTATRVVLNPMLTGKALGLEFYGQSSILVRGRKEVLDTSTPIPSPTLFRLPRVQMREMCSSGISISEVCLLFGDEQREDQKKPPCFTPARWFLDRTNCGGSVYLSANSCTCR